MPIEFACSCGKRFKTKDGSGGRWFRCPACQARLVVPTDDVSELGIVVPEPVRLHERPGRTRLAAMGRGALVALGTLAKLAGVLLLIAVVLVGYRSWQINRPRPDPSSERIWGQLDRMHEARLEREQLAAEKADRDEVAERVRVATSERAGREEREAEAREERLRAATTLVLAMPRPAISNGITITESEELPDGRIAFLARQNPFTRDGEEFPGGNVEAYLVEAGVATEVSEERFEWETLGPEDLAAAWADRYHQGEGGPYRAKVTARTAWPASLDAVVTSQTTGLRERLRFDHFNPSGTAELTLTAIDR